MTETTATKTPTPRCGKQTSSGPCHRPQGHPNTGCRSEAALKSRTKKSTLTLEEMQAKEKERAAAAKKRIADVKAAQAKRVEKLRADADALGFTLVAKVVETTEDDAS